MKTLHDLFHIAWRIEKQDGKKDATDFLRDTLYGCYGTKLDKEYSVWKKDNKIVGFGEDYNAERPRLVNVDFRIVDTRLSHQYDLDCFSKKVDHLFDCHESPAKRDKYVAPYFCFVQSSGMGKTKLLWEYQENSYRLPKPVTSMIVLPTDPTTVDRPIFPILNLDRAGPTLPPIQADMTQVEVERHVHSVTASIFEALDNTLKVLLEKNTEKKVHRVALLFDESQNLLKEEFGYKAYRFRCIRRWLMVKPTVNNFRGQNNLCVVAVFSGTSSKLTNFLFESDDELTNTSDPPSRNFIEHPDVFYDKGRTLHTPFWQTTTMGSCLDLLEEPLTLSEYEHAVYYGRPLFALMAKDGILHTKSQAILYRMLRRRTKWTQDNRNGLINMLSSRVQLGQVSVEVAADLVAHSYANICAYNEETRVIYLGYFPDPVPARLAMCMMDEDEYMDVEVSKGNLEKFKGQKKEWWSNALATIFSNEMVRPDKGDAGEIFAAFYMLYCGDHLRKLINMKNDGSNKAIMHYSQFSVSLDAWLQLLLSGGSFPEGKCPDLAMEDCKASVGFIQVCRNPLRSYTGSWKSLGDNDFLHSIYKSGIGFFVCNNCPTIDMVVPIRVESNEEGNIDGFHYVPMLISIKAELDYGDSETNKDWPKVDKRLDEAGITRAFYLLISFGSKEGSKPFKTNEAIQANSKFTEKLMKGIVKTSVRVPHDDSFGLSAAFAAILPTAQLEADLFASHAFLKAHGEGKEKDSPDLTAENALHNRATSELRIRHTALKNALATGSTGNPQDGTPPLTKSPKTNANNPL